MSRLSDSVLAAGTAYAGHAPVANLKNGGQNGHLASIGRVVGGTNYDEWISNQAYVKQNLIPIVLRYPKAFDYMPNPQLWIDTYNSLMTLHPLTIDGLQSGLTVDFDEHAIGGAGEVQEEFTKVSRARTSITNTYKEKAGKSITKFSDMVIRYLYSDPDVEKPLISNLPKYNADIANIKMYTPEYYTATHLYIEPDITQKYVIDAWLCTNVMIKGTGDRTGKRDIHSARETQDLSMELTSITMNNEAVLKLADSMLSNLKVLDANPDFDLTLPQTKIEAALDSGSKAGHVDFNRNFVAPATGI